MARNNTILSQLLKLVSRHEFESLTKIHHGGHPFRTASRWLQFVTLMMAQLSGRNSLRDIVENMAVQTHRLYHLGSAKLSRSNLSRTNSDNPNTLYEALFWKLLVCCQTVVPNNFKLAEKTIADIYKPRWQVELFFKWIKQNLKIKSFIGTSKNAVMTQIRIAMRVYLVLSFLKFESGIYKSLQQILRILPLNLFEKRDLMTLLRGDPDDPVPPKSHQMLLV